MSAPQVIVSDLLTERCIECGAAIEGGNICSRCMLQPTDPKVLVAPRPIDESAFCLSCGEPFRIETVMPSREPGHFVCKWCWLQGTAETEIASLLRPAVVIQPPSEPHRMTPELRRTRDALREPPTRGSK